MKQIVELLNPCLSTTTGLETNCRSHKPQNVPVPYGHVSQHFLAFLVMVLLILLAFPMASFHHKLAPYKV
jgi:hypothetical protein